MESISLTVTHINLDSGYIRVVSGDGYAYIKPNARSVWERYSPAGEYQGEVAFLASMLATAALTAWDKVAC